MKYVILLGDGMADEPQAALNGKTPLEHAYTPFMDEIAARGETGLLETVPDGLPPGSDVANLSAFGYDPRACYSGRSPLEAASMGVSLGPRDVAFRLNLICLEEDGEGRTCMRDFSAGHISTEEAQKIIVTLREKLGGADFDFYSGISYRHLMVWHDGCAGMRLVPPHDISRQPVADFLPQGEGGAELLKLMKAASEVLADHPVNAARKASGKLPANAIWLWGQGHAPKIVPLQERFGINGAVISAVDLIRGIGVCAGLEVIKVPGATGYLDTNYEGKADAALEALGRHDFVYVHVEAPDEMSHEGSLEKKLKAIELFDKLVVGRVLRGLERLEPFRVAVLPDHPTYIRTMTHAAEPVPYALLGSSGEFSGTCRARGFNEVEAARAGRPCCGGWKLLERMVRGPERP